MCVLRWGALDRFAIAVAMLRLATTSPDRALRGHPLPAALHAAPERGIWRLSVLFRFHPLPFGLHFVEARLGHGLARGGESVLDGAEAALELAVGIAERLF